MVLLTSYDWFSLFSREVDVAENGSKDGSNCRFAPLAPRWQGVGGNRIGDPSLLLDCTLSSITIPLASETVQRWLVAPQLS